MGSLLVVTGAVRCAHCHSTDLALYPTTDDYIRFTCDVCSSREVEVRLPKP